MKTYPINLRNAKLLKSALAIGVFALTLGGLTACSEKDIEPNDNVEGAVNFETSDLKVTTDMDYLNRFVTNYKSARSRSADDSLFDFIMPDEPAVPEGAVSLADLTVNDNTVNLYTEDLGWNVFSPEGIFVIPEGTTFSHKVNLASSNLLKVYIAGEFTGEFIGNNSKLEVHLLSTGKWNNANTDVQPDWSIFRYAGSVFDFAGHVTGFKGKLYTDDLTTEQNLHFTNGSILFVAEMLMAKNITFDSGARFTAHCVVGNDVYFTNATDIYLSAYIKAVNLKIDSKTKIHMRGAGFIKVDKYLWCGNVTKEGDSDRFVNEGTDACVISTDYYIACGSNQGDGTCSIANNLEGKFDFYIAQNGVSVFQNWTPTTFDQIGADNLKNYALDEVATNADTNLFGTGCEDLYDSCTAAVAAQKPGTDPEPGPELEVIAKVEMDHNHPISATCIDINGNEAYVSWHERGENMKGCVEVLTVDHADQQVSFKAWMETSEYVPGGDASDNAYDFNHVIYDSRTNSLLTVGDHSKKRGFVGQIKLNDFNTIGSEVDQNIGLLIPRQLPIAASGNSILRNGEDLYITCEGGFNIFPFADGEKFAKPAEGVTDVEYTRLSDCPVKGTEGSGKHIATDGTSIVTIEYTTRTGETRPAVIKLWNNSWIKDNGEATLSIDVPAFGPTDGKNVIALDGQYIYSCQGKNGVAIYDRNSGVEVSRFQVNDYLTSANGFDANDRNKMRNSAANGLCVYGDYVFVANGGAGVWVLDKANFKPVCHFTDAGQYLSLEMEHKFGEGTKIGASANYVKVTDDGYVYVAYGLAGVMVLKFNAQ